MTRNIIIKDDDQIIQECLSGNTDAYKNLVDKYQIRIVNACYKYTKNMYDAEDVAQSSKLALGSSHLRLRATQDCLPALPPTGSRRLVRDH